MSFFWTNNNCSLHLHIRGARVYDKVSYPRFCGIYSQLETATATLHFNLRGEIIRAWGKGRTWPHANEWLKRTAGNDWMYYSSGGYSGVVESIGEYYLPNLPYPTNSLYGGQPFADREVHALCLGWWHSVEEAAARAQDAPIPVEDFFTLALANDPERLAIKAERLFSLAGGRPSVIPPDARHVDYDLIPVHISSGCLYKCRFCAVKNHLPHATHGLATITARIDDLCDIYGADLANCGALFLGDHDGLQAGAATISASLAAAHRHLFAAPSHLDVRSAFVFGSVASLLAAPEHLFAELHHGPFSTYINIGLESADQATLDALGKPVLAAQVREAFSRIQELNDRYSSLEISANFVFDADLPPGHLPALLHLIRDSQPRTKAKGCVYLSPLRFNQPSRSRLFDFHRLKRASRLPTFLYIIQRM